MLSRYFQNPYKDYSHNSDLSFNIPSCKSQIEQYLSIGIKKNKCKPSGKYCSGGLYTGSLGMAFTAFYLLNKGALKENKDKQQNEKQYVVGCLQANQEYFLLGECNLGLVSGKGGLLFGKAIEAWILKDEEGIERAARMYASNWVDFEGVGGSDEIFVGRAGYLYGLVLMKKYFQIEPLPKTRIYKILDTLIESGRSYSIRTSSQSPLMYSYHGTEYLGAAHGLAGILQAILCFPNYLQATENNKAAKLVKDSVDFILTTRKSNGNYPSSMNGVRYGETKDLVHWCHGAAGVIFLFMKAYLVWSDNKYLQAALHCSDLIWERGLLKKGPGICHGIAGNGYAHLLLYRLTSMNKKYLYRAQKFAEFTQTREFKEEATIPDCPFSLFEGTAGLACFLADLLEPDKADHPIFPIF